MFRGREVTHPEQGTAILDRLAGELQDLAVIEQRPIQDGRNMTMLLAPSRSLLAGQLDPPSDDSAAGENNAGRGRDSGGDTDCSAAPTDGAAAPAPGASAPAADAAAPAADPSAPGGDAAQPAADPAASA